MTDPGETMKSGEKDQEETEEVVGTSDDTRPPCYVIYLLVLPDRLPVIHKSTWTRRLDKREPTLDGIEIVPVAGVSLWDDQPGRWDEGRNVVSLRFWQVRKDDTRAQVEWQIEAPRRVAHSLAPDELAEARSGDVSEWLGIQDYVTVVEAVTYVAEPADLYATESEADPLTRCIETLLDYHRAYRARGVVRVPPLTYQRLGAMVTVMRRPFPGGEDDRPVPHGVVLLEHTNIDVPEDEFLDDEAASEIGFWHMRLSAGDPFTLYAERRLDAEIERARSGRMGESIVQIGTASEVLLDGLLALMLWEEGMPVEEAGSLLSGPLLPRLESHATYCGRLKGQWNRKSEPLRGWYNRVWIPRSRVLHGNYRPSESDALDSMSALHALERYVGDRLKAQWRKYPHTAWLFLGEPGFGKRGGSRPADEWRQQQVSNPVRWARDYRAWRDTVDPHVVR